MTQQEHLAGIKTVHEDLLLIDSRIDLIHGTVHLGRGPNTEIATAIAQLLIAKAALLGCLQAWKVAEEE